MPRNEDLTNIGENLRSDSLIASGVADQALVAKGG